MTSWYAGVMDGVVRTVADVLRLRFVQLRRRKADQEQWRALQDEVIAACKEIHARVTVLAEDAKRAVSGSPEANEIWKELAEAFWVETELNRIAVAVQGQLL